MELILAICYISVNLFLTFRSGYNAYSVSKIRILIFLFRVSLDFVFITFMFIQKLRKLCGGYKMLTFFCTVHV